MIGLVLNLAMWLGAMGLVCAAWSRLAGMKLRVLPRLFLFGLFGVTWAELVTLISVTIYILFDQRDAQDPGPPMGGRRLALYFLRAPSGDMGVWLLHTIILAVVVCGTLYLWRQETLHGATQ